MQKGFREESGFCRPLLLELVSEFSLEMELAERANKPAGNTINR